MSRQTWINNANVTPENQPLPPTPLANSFTQGVKSESRAGNNMLAGSNPQARMEMVGTMNYLLDLEPDYSAARLVELQATAPFSGQTTLTISYLWTDQLEQNNYPQGGEFGSMSTPLRDHRILVKFGAGAATHDVECDVTEGGVITVPGCVVDVSLYSTAFNRWQGADAFMTQSRLKTQAHLSSFAGVSQATCTERVYAPMQVDLDLLNPPTIQSHMKALWDAICGEVYLLGAVEA